MSVDLGPFSEWQTHLGWTVAAASKWASRQLVGQSRISYVRLQDRGYVLTGVQNGLQSNVFRLGVNYRF